MPSTVKRLLVAATCLRKVGASDTLIANVPKARRRTGPNSASRIMIGFLVPHLWPVNTRVETKYASALNGELNPYFQPAIVERIGRLRVSSVYVPGLKTS